MTRSTDPARRIIAAALAAFPEDPDCPGERSTVTGYELVTTDGADPLAPTGYWAPVLGDAEPIARAVAAAVIRVIVDHSYRTTNLDAMITRDHQLRVLADIISRPAKAAP
jgi:hypothetical protein